MKIVDNLIIGIGKEGLNKTYQEDFPETTECVHCKGEARIALTLVEENGYREKYICSLHKNDPKGEGLWLHDCCAVAVYFCKDCLEPTALANQA